MTDVTSNLDDELLRRAVKNARSRTSAGYQTRWSCVAECFLVGSTYAAELCRRFGLDPDEKVRR